MEAPVTLPCSVIFAGPVRTAIYTFGDTLQEVAASDLGAAVNFKGYAARLLTGTFLSDICRPTCRPIATGVSSAVG